MITEVAGVGLDSQVYRFDMPMMRSMAAAAATGDTLSGVAGPYQCGHQCQEPKQGLLQWGELEPKQAKCKYKNKVI